MRCSQPWNNDVELLAALEAIPLPALSKPLAQKDSPLTEHFAWDIAAKKGGVVVDVFPCFPTAQGWRKGERLGWQALPQPGSAAWSGLGRNEQQAIAVLVRWQQHPQGIPFGLLNALERHTRVSWAPGLGLTPANVALIKVVSCLEVRQNAEGWRMKLTERPSQASVHLRLSDDRLLFTGFHGLHRALEGCLGEGRQVNAVQETRLAKLLGRLLPHIPLLTDCPPVPLSLDGPLKSRWIMWCRWNGAKLTYDLRILPAPGMDLALPGEGPALIVAGDPSHRQCWRRDLSLERHQIQQILSLLPKDAKAVERPYAWELEGRENVAKLLALIRDLPFDITLEGVSGRVPAIPERVSLQDLKLHAERTPQGLVVQGAVKGYDLGQYLKALASGHAFVGMPSGKTLELPAGLCQAFQQLGAWGQTAGEGIQMPLFVLPALWTLGLSSPTESLAVSLPPTFNGRLRSYQWEGFQWMARLLESGLGACLADDMGLGKTVQTAALLAHRAHHGPALVVAPTSVAHNWQEELDRFTPALAVHHLGVGDRHAILEGAGPGQVILASYGLLLSEAERLHGVKWGTVVLDEAHAIKNATTRRAQVSKLFKTGARLALTGTPVENQPTELASLMGWLLPAAEVRFAQAKVEELRLLAAPFLLRRRKSEVLTELPPRTDVTDYVAMEEVEANFYRTLLDRCRRDTRSGNVMHLLAALMKMRRACAHPRLVDPDYRGPAAKMTLLMDR